MLTSKLCVTNSDDVLTDTLILREGDPCFSSRTNNENVVRTGREFSTGSILDVNNIERTGVLIEGSDDTDTTSVVTAENNSLVA